jgi:hypothetical protein
MRARVNAQKRRLTRIAMEILTELRPESTIDLRVATFALFGMMNWLYNWYRPDRDLGVERLAEDMSRIFLGGFLQDAEILPAAAREASPGDSNPTIWRTAADV